MPAAMNLICWPFAKRAVHDPDEDDDAEIGVVPAVDEHRLERGVGGAAGGRDALDDGVEDLFDPEPGLGGGEDGLARVEADDLLDFLADPVGVGGGEVDLVDDGDDLVVVLDRLVDVGEGLRLDPLGGVDDEEGAFAGGQRARDFVGEVDVAGRVHQVELVALPVEPHRLRLDGDPALALDVHAVEQLLLHLALGEAARRLDQPVGKRRLAVVDMRDDAEVADSTDVGHFKARYSGCGQGGNR